MIKNVIFDFGNVLLNIDMQRIEAQITGLFSTLNHAQPVIDALGKGGIGKLYETGGISTEEFVAQLAHADRTGTLRPEMIPDIWNSIFIGMPAHRFEMLLSLRQTYNVFLLSNINELHLNWITDYMQHTHGILDFETRYFDGVYYSHLIRLRKPDADIYQYLLADADIKPEESVFFDDLPENIAAAQHCGINAYWHDPVREIMEHVQTVGLLK